MRVFRKKNITNESVEEENKLVPPEVEKLEPVVDHTTANTLASKEANEEAAEKNIKESGIEEVAKEVVDEIQDPKKDTEAPKTPSLKPYTEGKQVADRKALSALIKECKEAGKKYRIRRSQQEGYRYVFEELEEACEDGKCDPEEKVEEKKFDIKESLHDDNPTINDLVSFLRNTADEIESNYSGDARINKVSNTYFLGHPYYFLGIAGSTGGYINLDYPVSEDEEDVDDYDLDECKKQSVKEDVEEEVVVKEEEIPEDFDGRMDFLAADEQEAIDGYDKVLALLGEEDASVKEQLVKILEEEKAHKDFLEAVKSDRSLVYEHEHEEEKEEEPEIVAQEADLEVVEEAKEEKHVCPDCGKEICECDKKEEVSESVEEPVTEEKLEEAIVEPVSEPELDPDAVPAVDIVGEVEIKEPEVEVAPELDPEAEIEIDSIETFEPTDEIGKKTMTTIKDAGDGAMFAFKDTLKDLYNLKIKVSDLQQLLSSSSDWLLDLLGFNENHDEIEIHSEEIPEEPAEIEEPEIVGGEFDEVEPVRDLSTLDINDFDDVEPVDYEEEDEKFFVED